MNAFVSASPQFFKEANETYTKLQQEHESIRSKFSCNKNTPLESLADLLKMLEVWQPGTEAFLCLQRFPAAFLGSICCRTEPKTDLKGCNVGQKCGEWVRHFLPAMIYVSHTLVHFLGSFRGHVLLLTPKMRSLVLPSGTPICHRVEQNTTAPLEEAICSVE